MTLYCSIVVCFTLAHSFNVDVDNIVSFRGDNGTGFGYSALLLNNNDGRWVVVGAPRASFPDRTDIKTPGNVYRCKINFTRTEQDECQSLNIRTTESINRSNLTGFGEDDQLLGASMAHLTDKIVTCAPLWKYISDNKKVHPVGRCHNLDVSLKTTNSKVHVFKNSQSQVCIKEQICYEFAEAGFSISTKELTGQQYNDTKSILLGTPGVFEAKGGFLQYSYGTDDNFFESYSHKNISSDVKNSISNGTLMGYSVTTGNLAVSHDCPKVVVLGAPDFRTDNGKIGAVLVVCLGKDVMVIKKQVFGRKDGSGFGSSVVFEDINGDEIDDLIVGAPYQYDKVLDTGAVYIYHGVTDDNVLLESQQVLSGVDEFSRFGTSIECMGDMNKDGFKDIVVGAPYQNELRGAIFIYHGGSTGLTLVQEIYAIDINDRLRSFGWYISTAFDIDVNNYPDFVVGSYMSDTVSVFRTRPIINLSCTVNVNPVMIPLNSSGLECQDEHYRPCATVEICFRYHGINIPEMIFVSYTVRTDTLRTRARQSSRVFVYINNINNGSSYEETKVEVRKEEASCRKVHVIVPDFTRQFLAALKDELRFETSFGLSDESLPGQLKPILDNKPRLQISSVTFSSGCNGTCHPDLKLDITSDPEEIIYGSTVEIIVKLKVINIGEPSHGTRLTIYTSENTQYLGFYQPHGFITELGYCNQELDQTNKTVIYCDLQQKSLYQQQQWMLNVRFNVSRETLDREDTDVYKVDRNVTLDVAATSTSNDKDMSDNRVKLTVHVKMHSELELSGISTPEQHVLSNVQILEVSHTYDLYNAGPSPMEMVSVHICMPFVGQIELFKYDELKVVTSHKGIKWSVSNVPDNTYTKSTNTSQQTDNLTATVPTIESSIKPRGLSGKSKHVLQIISCDNVDQTKHVIYDVTISSIAVGQRATFDIPFVIHERDLNFEKVSAILFKTTGDIEPVENDKFSVTAMNTTFNVTTEIFPEVIPVLTDEINIWIIIGGCVGGVGLLIAVGVLLWKCGFFERQKKADVDKWKRQSGYYASRKGQFYEHNPRQSTICNYSVQW